MQTKVVEEEVNLQTVTRDGEIIDKTLIRDVNCLTTFNGYCCLCVLLFLNQTLLLLQTSLDSKTGLISCCFMLQHVFHVVESTQA